MKIIHTSDQCGGSESGSVRIGNFFSDPDLDLNYMFRIWIRVWIQNKFIKKEPFNQVKRTYGSLIQLDIFNIFLE